MIRALRIKKLMLQEDVADKAGISVGQLSRIERGKVEPSRETIEKLAPVLGVTAAYLDVQALSDAVVEQATDPEARSFVERMLGLHDRLALLSDTQRERLYRLIDKETRRTSE